MSNRGEFVGTAPDSGNYIPSPVPADQEDLPVYVNDELLRLGGTVNGMLEGGTLPPHSSLPKRYREGMIMNFSGAVGDGVDSSGVWLYKNAKWWKLIDDPSVITGPINDRLDDIDTEIDDLNSDLDYLNNTALPELRDDLDYLNNTALPELQTNLDNLNNVTLPAVQADLDNLNDTVLPEVQAELDDLNNVQLPALTDDLAELDGKFPITEVDISDDAISAPKLQANSVIASKIISGAISTEKLASLSVTTDKLVANAVTVHKLAANSVNAEKIVGKTITGDKIAANTIEGDKIVANSVNGNRITTNTLHGNKIVANSINGDRIIANTIYGDKLIANTVNGNKINSATKVTAGSGNASASLDGADSKWRIYAGSSNPASAPFRVDKDGNVFATSGTFGGTIYADKVDGDFTDTVSKVIPYTAIPAVGNSGAAYTDIYSLKVPSFKPYVRTIRIDQIAFECNDNSNKLYGIYVYKQGLDPSGNPSGPEQIVEESYIYPSPSDWVTLSRPVYFQVPANTACQFRIVLYQNANTAGGQLLEQTVSATLFKQGNELSFV